MNEAKQLGLEVVRLRDSGWQKDFLDEFDKRPPREREIAAALLAPNDDKVLIARSALILDSMPREERRRFWEALFPQFSSGLEGAWTGLETDSFARWRPRKVTGCPSFLWKLEGRQGLVWKFYWLRLLMELTGALRSWPIERIIAGADTVIGGADVNRRPTFTGRDGSDRIKSGSLALLLAAILEERNARADQVAELLFAQIRGERYSPTLQHAHAAIFWSRRKDLWSRHDDLLADAGKDEGFRTELLKIPEQVHPAALSQRLRSIESGGLLRFNSVCDWLKSRIGHPLRTCVSGREVCEALVQRLGKLLDSPESRSLARQSARADEVLIALWAEAAGDADRAIESAIRLCDGEVNERIAAAMFSRLLPAEDRRDLAVRLLRDSDSRVSTHAVSVITAPDAPRLHLPEDAFSRLLDAALNPDTLQIESEAFDLFAPASPDRAALLDRIADSFPDDAIDRIEELLPKMGAETRIRVMDRLTRRSFSKDDVEVARIVHSEPGEFERWKKEREGAATPEMRRFLISFLGDQSPAVARHAHEKLASEPLASDDLPQLAPFMGTSDEQRRSWVASLIGSNSEDLATIENALASTDPSERLCALGALQHRVEKQGVATSAHKLLTRLGFRPSSNREKEAVEALGWPNRDEASRRPPGTWATRIPFPIANPDKRSRIDAFGLVLREQLRKPVKAVDRGVRLHSPVSVSLIRWIDYLMEVYQDVTVPSYRAEKRPFKNSGIPSLDTKRSREENLERFPLAAEFGQWWVNRHSSLRDPDGYEIPRVRVYLEMSSGLLDRSPFRSPRIESACRSLFGSASPIQTNHDPMKIRFIFDWIEYLYPGGEPVKTFAVDAFETAVTRLSDRDLWEGRAWYHQAVKYAVFDDPIDPECAGRLWSLLRFPSPLPFDRSGYFVLDLHGAGVITDAEFIWQVSGAAEGPKAPTKPEHFALLKQATSGITRTSGERTLSTRTIEMTAAVRDRILDLELRRGEAPGDSSIASTVLGSIPGASWLFRVLGSGGGAAGKLVTRRDGDFSKSAVLNELLGRIHPQSEDDAGLLAGLETEYRIGRKRLLEAAFQLPEWTRHLVGLIGIEGLSDAVNWFFAHSRDRDTNWRWLGQHLWPEGLGVYSDLTEEELSEGVADVAWFHRAFERVGDSIWAEVHDAAKCMGGGKSHVRPRLFSDALRGKIDREGIGAMLLKNHSPGALIAIGLPSLPEDSAERSREIFHRFETIQDYKALAGPAKSRKRLTIDYTTRSAMRNLSRAAGYRDVFLFEWLMEIQMASDLSDGGTTLNLGDYEASIGIDDRGRPGLVCRSKKGPVSRVPAALKGLPGFKDLKERVKKLEDQHRRFRRGLEGMMIDGVVLAASDWKDFFKHPMLGAMLENLLFADDSGEVLGFPRKAGGAFRAIAHEFEADGSGMWRIAHPADLGVAMVLDEWRTFLVKERLPQPFEQLFRDVFLPTQTGESEGAKCTRYGGQEIKTLNAFAILAGRDWIHDPEEGSYRFFRRDGLKAFLEIDPPVRTPSESPEVALRWISWGFGHRKPSEERGVPPRIFSEVMRDLDLVVSVAHASGFPPPPSISTLETRRALVQATCQTLGIGNVKVSDSEAIIDGERGRYRVSLTDGNVVLEPGTVIPLISSPVSERGPLFLPFDEDDPVAVDILSRVMLFAKDGEIRDPAILRFFNR